MEMEAVRTCDEVDFEPAGASELRPVVLPDDEPSAARTDEIAELVPIVESLLFAAGSPVAVGRLVEVLEGPSRSAVLAAL